MSGFDVTRADKNRARGLVALAALGISAALAIALWTSRDAEVQAETFIAETSLDVFYLFSASFAISDFTRSF